MLTGPWLALGSGVLTLASLTGVAVAVGMRRRDPAARTPLGRLALGMQNLAVFGACVGVLLGCWQVVFRLVDQRDRRAVDRWAAALGSAEPVRQLAACEALAKLHHASAVAPLSTALADPCPAVQLEALRALRVFGPIAAPATLPLARWLADPALDEELRREAHAALRAIGPDAVPLLRDALGGDDRVAGASAAAALCQVGAAGRAELVRALRSGRPEERYHACLGLLLHGAEIPAALPALVANLKHSNPEVQWVACAALVRVSPGSAWTAPGWPAALSASLPRWIVHAGGADPVLRTAASGLLASVWTAPDGIQSQVVRALRDPERAAAVLTHVEALGGVPEASVRDLVPLLRHDETREAAALYLAAHGWSTYDDVVALAADRSVSPATTNAAWTLIERFRRARGGAAR